MKPPFVFPAAPFIPAAFVAGFIPLGFLGQCIPVLTQFRPAAPTGWKSTGRRLGPDPAASRGLRIAGQGEGVQ